MARCKIREYHAKKLICNNIQLEKGRIEHTSALVTLDTDLSALPKQYPWLLHTPLVVKPDQVFGKRKKMGLVGINFSFLEVQQFIQQQRRREISIEKATDRLTHFLIEPFIPHEQEFYIAFISERDYDTILFSEQGGVDIEENWNNVAELKVPTLMPPEKINADILTSNPLLQEFILALFRVFRDFDFTYLELNPFTIIKDTIYLLDTVAQVDDCAVFKNMNHWVSLEFPKEFGKTQYAEERIIEELDQKSGASLKLSILNRHGKLWNILGGGGASIIYLDMITNLGKGKEIANYGEASGNPSMEESYEYAKAILKLMLENEGRILFIVGGIANFTDVYETFKGYIRALQEQGPQLRAHNVKIFIRRGGPHWEKGLQSMKETCEKLGLQHFVHGPETPMPEIIKIAQESL